MGSNAPKYKMIAVDLDGTLLQNGVRTVEPSLFPLIHDYVERGGVFLPASGRQYGNLRTLFAPVKDEITYICENGCLIFHQNRLIYRSVMERELGISLINCLRELPGVEILVSGKYTCYVEPDDMSFYKYMTSHVKNHTTRVPDLRSIPEDFFKISGYCPDGTDAFSQPVYQQFGDILNVVTGGGNWLDIMPKEINKGTALKKLAEDLGIDLADAVAIGDQMNDMEMLNAVGHPACVANAVDAVKAVCEKEAVSGAELLAEFLQA